MAEALDVDNNKDSVEITSIIEYCGPCMDDGIYKSARGYCVDCNDYLCDNCYKHHRIPKPCRNHIVQDIDTNTSSDISVQNLTFEVVFKCPLHKEREAIAYSKSKDEYYCETCMSVLTGRGVDSDIVTISELSKGVQDGTEFKSFEGKLECTINVLEKNRNRIAHSNRRRDKYYESLSSKFNTCLEIMKAEDENKARQMATECDTAIKKFKTILSVKDKFWKSDSRLFALLKLNSHKLDSEVKSYETILMTPLPKYSFIDQTAIGEQVASVISLFERIERPAKLISQLNLKHVNDKSLHMYSIVSMVLLKNGLLLVSDSGNYSLKLLNIDKNLVLSGTKLTMWPYEMAVSDENRVFVTIPKENKLLRLDTPTTDVSDYKEIPINEPCYAVSFYQDKLKCIFSDSCKLVETNDKGSSWTTFKDDISKRGHGDNTILMTNPTHCTSDIYTGSTFISCYVQNSITEITEAGNIRQVVKSSELKEPRGIAVDADGSILVCSTKGKTVLRVTDDGRIKDDVLPSHLDFAPYSLALDESKRELYDAGHSCKVMIYQI